MLDIILVICAYLLGSVSTAVLVSKRFYGVDIRELGSGNAGATNTFRVLGRNAGIIVMIGDMGSRFCARLASWIASSCLPRFPSSTAYQ